MMPAPQFDRFLRALHRKYTFVRGAERIGMCLLIASGLSLLIAPLLSWAGRPTLPITLFILAAAGGLGLFAAISRRPTPLDAAMEADRQLQLSDLLGTALKVQHRSDDPWAVTVLAIAEARCAAISPSTILLNRWGARAWGGVSLAAALVLSLGMIFTQPLPSPASAKSLQLFGENALNPPRVPFPSVQYSPQHRAVIGQTPQDDNPNPPDPTSATPTAASVAGQTPAAAKPSPEAALSDPTGTGAGAGNTTISHPIPDTPLPDGTRGQSPGHGPTATGGQAADTTATGQVTNPAPGNTAGQNRSGANAPPWTNSNWPTAARQAMKELQTNPDRDAYRDLIRDYFGKE